MAPESSRDQCNKEGCNGCRHCSGNSNASSVSIRDLSVSELKTALKKAQQEEVIKARNNRLLLKAKEALERKELKRLKAKYEK